MGEKEELGVSQRKGEQVYPAAEKDAPWHQSHKTFKQSEDWGEAVSLAKLPVSRQSPETLQGCEGNWGP